MNDRNRLGTAGEHIARDYLVRKGYHLLAQNWRYRHTEIDLIAREGDTIVIIEVKTRSGSGVERPELAVNRAKQGHLAKAARAFLASYSLRERGTHGLSSLLEVRFDIIAIRKEGNKWLIHHLEDAFFPTS